MLDTYRKKEFIEKILKKIPYSCEKLKIMEVCGTHTMTIYRYGLYKLFLEKNIELISGPGCPVCVTPDSILIASIEALQDEKVILASFGDMLKVPTPYGNLINCKKKGKVKIIYSPFEVLKLAKENPDKEIVFLAVGFETTIPSIAFVVKKAFDEGIKNLSLIMSLKLIPPTLDLLFSNGVFIDGLIYPGHVSAIIGASSYEFIADKYKIPGVITGFEPLDIVIAVYLILKKLNIPWVGIEYKRVVTKEGNIKAKEIMFEVFDISDEEWRGMGILPRTGLKLRKKYERFDYFKKFSKDTEFYRKKDFSIKGCRCGEVLQGKIKPEECPLFRKICTPQNPLGPCMVSIEGACLIHYKYA